MMLCVQNQADENIYVYKLCFIRQVCFQRTMINPKIWCRFRRLNAELEAKTATLVQEAETVIVSDGYSVLGVK